MTIVEIATAELIKRGMNEEFAQQFAKDLLIGFPLEVAELYARQKWKEACKAQRDICHNTKILSKYDSLGLELTKAIRTEVKNAKQPAFK